MLADSLWPLARTRCRHTCVIGQAASQCEEEEVGGGEEDDVEEVPACWLVLPNVAEDDEWIETLLNIFIYLDFSRPNQEW